jgi:plasmid replication initiation protein
MDEKPHKLQGYKADNLERQVGDRWVAMKNALTRASHGLTLAEKRLVMLGISKIDSHKVYKPLEVPTCKITAAEFAEAYGLDMNGAYEQLKDASKMLMKRHITIFEPAHHRKGRPLKPIRTDMVWVGRCKYHEGEGWIELGWWPELMPFISGILKGNFTTYQLKQASALRSMYSWRLLELLMRFESTGWAEYTIEDFATSMDATDKQKADFAAIRRRIIEPAVLELVQKDGWIIKWTPIKAGRKVAKLRFEFKRNPQGQLDL